ncbi:MAG: helix-turn-helix domain-containing protein [Clostridia bacterium]|nr:helix-turn-helix domain-containing protein [Clostridia bacterium]
MMTISSTIARLRREHGMTQEALAEVIGVTSQTISKWENATTYPDIALLPVLADVFDVTIDALYGREEQQHTVTADAAIDRVIEYVRQTIVAAFYKPEVDGSFEEELATYKRAMQDEHCRSVLENDRDVLYFREKLGALALRKPENGWNSLFADERNVSVLRLLADKDFRKAMQVILQRRMLTFTLPSLMKAAPAEDAESLERCLLESGFFNKRELMIDEAPLTYYELTMGEQKLFLLYAILAFAQEYANYHATHYCFIGNSNYFTP